MKYTIRRYAVLCLALICLIAAAMPAYADKLRPGNPSPAADTGEYEVQTITLTKIPVDITADLNQSHIFVKGLLEESEVSLERAGADAQEIAGYLEAEDNEVLMIPAQYTLDNTPIFLYVFITDGFSNQDASLINLQTDGIRYLYDLIQGFYKEEEQAQFTAADINEARYIIADSLYMDDEVTDTPVRNYYTLWNGDFVQVELVYLEECREEAFSWAEQFLQSWTDAG